MQTITAKKTITLAGFGELESDDAEMLRRFAAENNVEFYPTYYDHELRGDADAIEEVTQSMWGMSSAEWADNGFTVNQIERVADDYTSTWEMQIVANGEMNYYGRLTDEQIKRVVEFANGLVTNEAFTPVQ